MAAPTHLRAEHRGDAVLGLGEPRPRLSWQLPDGTRRQVAYAIELNGEDTGRTDSDASALVPWPAQPVPSRRRVQWRVKVWTDAGESEWSAPAWFETGLLHAADWVARWIEPQETERSAHVLRRTFELARSGADARLYATAHGIYETFLNGQRVGDVELTPGFTSYPTTLHVQTYDVGDLLVEGENRWEVVLCDGWWRGRTGFFQCNDGLRRRPWPSSGQLHADDDVVTTGAEWESATGPLLRADLMAGQTRGPPGRGHRDGRPSRSSTTAWQRWPARRRRRPAGYRSSGRSRSPVPSPDRQVVDLGQNINGWLRLPTSARRAPS